MLPVIALVGRPNVGKSTLFNRLTGTRDAIVADMPGVTRDRQYGFGRLGGQPYIVVDTGGLVEQPSGLESPMRESVVAVLKGDAQRPAGGGIAERNVDRKRIRVPGNSYPVRCQ